MADETGQLVGMTGTEVVRVVEELKVEFEPVIVVRLVVVTVTAAVP